MDPTKRVALKLKMFKIIDNPIRMCLYGQKALKKKGISTKLVTGWVTGHSDACWHVWLEDDNMNSYDIVGMLAKVKEPNLADFTLTKEKPDDRHIIVEGEEYMSEFALYEKDPKQYWKGSTKKLLNLGL